MHPTLFFVVVALAAAQSNVTSTSGTLSGTSLIPTFARAAGNSSNIIVAGYGGASYNLDQCNAQCANVNSTLFSSCAFYQDNFRNQMQCSCSEAFYSYAQVVYACQVIQAGGNTNKISYTTVTNQATQTETQIQTEVETYTAHPTQTIITSIYPVVSTVYYTDGASETTYSVCTSSMTSIYSTTYTPVETETSVYTYYPTTTTTSTTPTPTNTMPIYTPTSNAATRLPVSIGQGWQDAGWLQMAFLVLLLVLSSRFV